MDLTDDLARVYLEHPDMREKFRQARGLTMTDDELVSHIEQFLRLRQNGVPMSFFRFLLAFPDEI